MFLSKGTSTRVYERKQSPGNSAIANGAKITRQVGQAPREGVGIEQVEPEAPKCVCLPEG